MMRIFLTLLLLASSCLADSALTWNLEWFPGKKGTDKAVQRMETAQSVLSEIGPADIYLFQEINDWEAAMTLVENLPGCKVDMVTRFPGQQQMAIASSFPLDSAWYEAFKPVEGDKKTPPRGFAFAALEPRPKEFILVYSVHLKSNSGRNPAANIAAREESARQLIRHVEEMKRLYGEKGKVSVIIAGDMNTLQDSPEFAAEKTIPLFLKAGFDWCWKDIPREKRITWPPSGSFDGATFDHFFTQGLPDQKATILDGRGTSDHHPVRLSW